MLSWIVIFFFPPQIQGAILVSSLLQLVLGFSGLVGLVLRFIGPLAIAPTINLIGLSLFIEAGKKCGTHWGIAALWVFTRTLVWLSDLSLALSLMLQRLYLRLFEKEKITESSKFVQCHKRNAPLSSLLPFPFFSLSYCWNLLLDLWVVLMGSTF